MIDMQSMMQKWSRRMGDGLESSGSMEAKGEGHRALRNSGLATDEFLRIYRTMWLSRFFDDRCNAIVKTGEPVPHFHSGWGQEALMVASVAPLRQADQIIYTHRGYGHLMAKGVSVREIALDTFMKFGGTNNGMGGIMHVSRPDLGVPGREGVFGTRFSIAAGLALASRLDGRDDVTVCYYGEAAGARGILYEAMNMAVLWKLPVIFVAENNGWSYSIKTEQLYPEGRMSRVWRGFDIPVEVFDGNDVETVHDAVSRAVDRARVGEGPSVLEGLTYRIDSHHWFDKAKYQPEDEIARWREKDPIERAHRNLLKRGVGASVLSRVAEEAETEVDEAMDMAGSARLAQWADSKESAVRW